MPVMLISLHLQTVCKVINNSSSPNDAANTQIENRENVFVLKSDFRRFLQSKLIIVWAVTHDGWKVHKRQDGTKSLKLGDFGLATVVTKPLRTVCGTLTYVAPEVLAEVG